MTKTDDRRIKQTRVTLLTVDELRHLSRWCDNQHGSWWSDLGALQILGLYHAANDAGYAGMDDWNSEEPEAAQDAHVRARTEALLAAEVPA